MIALFSVISFLCLCIMRASDLHSFPEKFMAGMKYGSITLTCDTDEEPVEWKCDGEDFPEFNGKDLTLFDLQEDLTGNYTCWNKGKIVDYTYVLIDISSDITESPISCTAETFNCTSSISCTMSSNDFQYIRLRNERDNGNWLSPSNKWMFQLGHSNNPFEEEAEPVVVIGEAVSSLKYYFKTISKFYLRDIIKPGSPKLSLKKKQVIAEPPVTWTMPLSYFPLEHEIEIQKRDNNKIETQLFTSFMNIPSGAGKVRIRCRDMLLLSQWSDWTQWKNVCGKRSKNCKKQKDRKKSNS